MYIVIEKIELPDKTRGKWDFLDKLEEGQCIAVETEQEAMRVRDALRHRGYKYTVKKMRDAYRVWKL